MDKNMKKIIIVFIILILIIGSYFIWNKFIQKDENKYLTVKELYDDWDMDEYYKGVSRCNFKSFNAGDNITIIDYVVSNVIVEVPDIELNKTYVKYSKPLYSNITYTTVEFKSGGSLAFVGNQLDNYTINTTVKFSVQVKEYDFIPIYYELYGGEMIEEFYLTYHILLLGVINLKAHQEVNITLSIDNISNNQAIINIDSLKKSDLLSNAESNNLIEDQRSCNPEDLRIVLFRDNAIVDEIYYYGNDIVILNEILNYNIEKGNRRHDFDAGDKFIINDFSISNQTYKLEIYLRYTWPEPGLDKERVVGSIEFVM